MEKLPLALNTNADAWYVFDNVNGRLRVYSASHGVVRGLIEKARYLFGDEILDKFSDIILFDDGHPGANRVGVIKRLLECDEDQLVVRNKVIKYIEDGVVKQNCYIVM